MNRKWRHQITLDTSFPNAVALGISPAGVIFVTRGLKEKLTEPELKAVLAHEEAHLSHNDGLLFTGLSYIWYKIVKSYTSDAQANGLKPSRLALHFAQILAFGLPKYVSEYRADKAVMEAGMGPQLACALNAISAHKSFKFELAFWLLIPAQIHPLTKSRLKYLTKN